MPLLALLLKGIFLAAARIWIGLQAQNWAVRIAIVAALAAAYVACVVGFSTVVSAWWGMFTTTGYGAVVGLAFPPISGTVLAGLIGLWGCILAKRLTVRLLKAF